MQSILTYNGQEITQRPEDGYVNATEMSKANNYVLAELIRSDRFKNYLKVLENSDSGLSPESAVIVTAEGFPAIKTTWVHPLVALMIAQDISPEFHVWCNIHIKTLIETGSVAIAPEKPMSQDDQMLLLAESVQRLIGEKRKLQAQIEADEPATTLGKAIGCASNCIRIGDFAKAIGMGQNTYFQELRDDSIIQLTSVLPYQRYLTAGYFVVTEVVKNKRIFMVAMITPKGQVYLAKRHQKYVLRDRTEDAMEKVISAIV
jgi:anti-repressor protein